MPVPQPAINSLASPVAQAFLPVLRFPQPASY